jgi:hypothetical protein
MPRAGKPTSQREEGSAAAHATIDKTLRESALIPRHRTGALQCRRRINPQLSCVFALLLCVGDRIVHSRRWTSRPPELTRRCPMLSILSSEDVEQLLAEIPCPICGRGFGNHTVPEIQTCVDVTTRSKGGNTMLFLSRRTV